MDTNIQYVVLGADGGRLGLGVRQFLPVISHMQQNGQIATYPGLLCVRLGDGFLHDTIKLALITCSTWTQTRTDGAT